MANVYVKTIMSQSQAQALFNAFLAQIISAKNVKPFPTLHKRVINAFKMHITMLAHANVKISSINRDLNVSLALLAALLARLQEDVPHVKQVQTQVALLLEIKLLVNAKMDFTKIHLK